MEQAWATRKALTNAARRRARGNEASTGGRPAVSRPPGLTWPQTYVLKAVGDLAMEYWDRRLTVGHVAVTLAEMGMDRRQVERALDPLAALGYVFADDAPGNPEIMLLLTAKGLEA